MTRPARIPSDVNRPDKVLGPLTARQVAILAATAGLLYLAWLALRPVIPLLVFLIAATPIGALAFLLAVGQRDGLSLDRLLLAAMRHRLTRPARSPHPRRTHHGHGHNHGRGADQRHGSPGVPGWLTAGADLEPDATGPPRRTGRRVGGFPARAVTEAVTSPGESGGVGVVDLGTEGLVVIAAVSTVNLSLRTPTEQDSLVDSFARYLHTLTAPVQILVRAVPLDLTDHLRRLHDQARTLPHPALAAAADAHRTHLARLATRRSDDELLTRQVLLVLREPTRHSTGPDGGRGAERRLLRRLGEAASLLAPLDVTVTPLPARQTIALLTSITNPDLTSSDLSTATGSGDPREHRPARRRLTAEPPDAAAALADEGAPRTWSPAGDPRDETGPDELEMHLAHPVAREIDDNGWDGDDWDSDGWDGDIEHDDSDQHPDDSAQGRGESGWSDDGDDIDADADADARDPGATEDPEVWDDGERNDDGEGWGPDPWTEPAPSHRHDAMRDRRVRDRGGASWWGR